MNGMGMPSNSTNGHLDQETHYRRRMESGPNSSYFGRDRRYVDGDRHYNDYYDSLSDQLAACLGHHRMKTTKTGGRHGRPGKE